MDVLTLANLMIFCGLFSIWRTNSWLNISIRMTLATMFVWNILRLTGKA